MSAETNCRTLAGPVESISSFGLSRRTFLAGTGLAVGFTLMGRSERAAAASPRGELRINPTAPGSATEAWLILTPAAYTIYSGKVELGTGVQTALSQIVAEELRLTVDDFQYVQGDTIFDPNQGFTAGSKTLQQGGVTLRQAAATAYAALLQMAADYLNVDPATLVARKGHFEVSGSQRSVSYRELLGQTDTVIAVDAQAAQVPPSDYQLVGTDAPRVDLPSKATASFTFTADVAVPGMLHGRVIRPEGRNATYGGVTNLERARAIPGFVQFVQRQNFVGVVATSEWAAARAANPTTGVTVTWNTGAPLLAEDDLATELRDPSNHYAMTVERNDGDVDAAFASGANTVEAAYFTPFQMHGTVGASCGVADVRAAPDPATGIQATVWSGTQGVNNLRGAIATLLALPATAVHVLYEEAAGCYGHDGADDASADAALLSQAVGKPVRVQWTRQNEHGWEPLGPAQAHDMKAAYDSTGVTAWLHKLYAATHSGRPSVTNAGTLIAGQLTGSLPDPLPSTAGDSAGRNSEVTYAFDNQRLEAHLVKSYVTTSPSSRTPASPLTWLLPRSSSLRSLGGFSNSFANESFLDEVAHAAGLDPLQIRLDAVTDPRGRAVLQALAPAWAARPTGGSGVGAGIAYHRYELIYAYVATYVEVAVDDTGSIRVQRVVVAHDCGLIVNPDGLRHQIEGNVIQGISRTLHEEVHYSGDAVTTVLWQPPPGTSAPQYRVIRFNEVPEIETILINQPDQPAWGAGEPAIGTVGAAIGNAVFAATGKRVRTLPMTPERVLNG